MQTYRTGLRSEILLTLAMLLGSSLLLGGFLFLRYAEQNLLQQRTHTTTLGMRLVATSLADMNLFQKSVKPDILFNLNNQLNAESWWFFDRDLTLQFSYRAGENKALPAGMLRQILLHQDEVVDLTWPGLLSFLNKNKQSSLQIAVPVKSSGSSQGVLIARFPLDDIFIKFVSAQRWLLLYVLAFGTVLVAAGLYLLNRNIVRPTQKLLEATQNITAGDLNLRLEKSGPREIHALATSFNAMVDALQKSRLEAENLIHSLREINNELQQTQHELIRSEKLSTVGHLAAGMAHEIGNPLGALTGYLSLLQKDLQGTPESEILRQAIGAAERIDRLVRELLDYAAPTDPLIEAIDPWIAVKESAQLLELQGTFNEIALIYDKEQVLPEIKIDHHKLGQVIVNLLLNSKDACTAGGQISITGCSLADQVEIRISDNGCGIPPDQMGAIFEPFYTTKAPGKGRGLGLAICQRIVAEAQGEIHCESLPGQGCTFSLIFPKTDQIHA